MPKIKVSKPFVQRLGRGEKREFGVGEHEVSKRELAHWFMQGCIKEGRAHVVSEAEPAEPGKVEQQSDKPRKAGK